MKPSVLREMYVFEYLLTTLLASACVGQVSSTEDHDEGFQYERVTYRVLERKLEDDEFCEGDEVYDQTEGPGITIENGK